MKQIKFNSGGQPFRNADFALQQAEIYKAIENQFADTNGFVFSGCVVTGNNISPGLVYLDGKIRELAAATGLTFPCYIKASSVIEYDSRLHTEDNNNKTTKQEYRAEIVNSIPTSGDYITVTANGVDKRLVVNTKNSQNEYAITGFEQNKGKVSYVELSRTTNQTVTANTIVAIDFTSKIDDLNEFDVPSGEFTALNSGIYSIHCSVRTDLTGEGFEIFIEFFNGSSWVTFANGVRNLHNGQGAITVSAVKKLSAFQKIRIRYSAVGASNKVIQWAYASIARVG